MNDLDALLQELDVTKGSTPPPPPLSSKPPSYRKPPPPGQGKFRPPPNAVRPAGYSSPKPPSGSLPPQPGPPSGPPSGPPNDRRAPDFHIPQTPSRPPFNDKTPSAGYAAPVQPQAGPAGFQPHQMPFGQAANDDPPPKRTLSIAPNSVPLDQTEQDYPPPPVPPSLNKGPRSTETKGSSKQAEFEKIVESKKKLYGQAGKPEPTGASSVPLPGSDAGSRVYQNPNVSQSSLSQSSISSKPIGSAQPSANQPPLQRANSLSGHPPLDRVNSNTSQSSMQSSAKPIGVYSAANPPVDPYANKPQGYGYNGASQYGAPLGSTLPGQQQPQQQYQQSQLPQQPFQQQQQQPFQQQQQYQAYPSTSQPYQQPQQTYSAPYSSAPQFEQPQQFQQPYLQQEELSYAGSQQFATPYQQSAQSAQNAQQQQYYQQQQPPYEQQPYQQPQQQSYQQPQQGQSASQQNYGFLQEQFSLPVPQVSPPAEYGAPTGSAPNGYSAAPPSDSAPAPPGGGFLSQLAQNYTLKNEDENDEDAFDQGAVSGQQFGNQQPQFQQQQPQYQQNGGFTPSVRELTPTQAPAKPNNAGRKSIANFFGLKKKSSKSQLSANEPASTILPAQSSIPNARVSQYPGSAPMTPGGLPPNIKPRGTSVAGVARIKQQREAYDSMVAQSRQGNESFVNPERPGRDPLLPPPPAPPGLSAAAQRASGYSPSLSTFGAPMESAATDQLVREKQEALIREKERKLKEQAATERMQREQLLSSPSVQLGQPSSAPSEPVDPKIREHQEWERQELERQRQEREQRELTGAVRSGSQSSYQQPNYQQSSYQPSSFSSQSLQLPDVPTVSFNIGEFGLPSESPIPMEPAPICIACHQPINDDMVKIDDRAWHPEHFQCDTCRKCLAGLGYAEDEVHGFVCEDCFNNLPQEQDAVVHEDQVATDNADMPVCDFCHSIIDDQCVTALGKTWHPEHFLCAHCKQPFEPGAGFLEHEGYAYCEKDYHNLFSMKCGRCQSVIDGDYVTAFDRDWHTECFGCAVCGINFPDGVFFEYEGQPYCEEHYPHPGQGTLRSLNAAADEPRCGACQGVLNGDCIESSGIQYHIECFGCSNCGKRVGDDPNGDDVFREVDDRIYCEECCEQIYGSIQAESFL
ncbi:uncharacterized protein BJ171DRAFT_30113 [Polychytrium aggregatum]|uniref:uncharacterized protein n=1 Tax=Polychytrium aggregatum TaxID=110093 RepID=UPI0022FF06CE|nr:uncharacterized protein BJ171DRAFT_30113 [Polychytrium aggregatum]KAI9206418.1 hypothetical protein BJ171DRAFT_30113 [Polychytrium aggregatum]